MGEGTGIPEAIRTYLMAEGLIKQKGVFPPEDGVNPIDILKVLLNIVGKGEIPILVEKIDEKGIKEKIDSLSLIKTVLI